MLKERIINDLEMCGIEITVGKYNYIINKRNVMEIEDGYIRFSDNGVVYTVPYGSILIYTLLLRK